MKKHSLLTLLPFALIVTGCSGNFSKGSVFNEKFMKYNFGEEIHKEVSYEGYNKVELALGDDIVSVDDISAHGLLKVTKSGEKYGFFNAAENKYVLPVEKWDSHHILTETPAESATKHRIYVGVIKIDEENKTFKAFDEHGNQILAEAYHGEGFGLTEETIDSRNIREGSERYRQFFRADGVLKLVIKYDVDGSLIETIDAKKFLEDNPHYSTWGTASKAEYGHKELLFKETATTNGKKVVVFNKEKGKIISQFVIPSDVIGASELEIGDYYYYQRETKLNERETNFDLFNDGEKYNIDTFRVNYLTGKTESIATSLYFGVTPALTKRGLYDKKGFLTLEYLQGVKEIRKDKSLSEPKSLIVNESLKEVADVSGINFTKANIKPFGDGLYLDIESKVVYDKEFKEVAYYNGASQDSRVITLQQSCGKGLVDVNGNVIFGGPSVKEITPLRVKDHYKVDYVDAEKKFEIVKVVNEQVEVIKGFNTKEHTYVANSHEQFASEALATVQDKDSKYFLLDLTTGNLTSSEGFNPEEGSSALGGGASKVIMFGESLCVDLQVYQRTSDKSCYAFRDATKTVLSYPVFEK